MDRTTVLAPLRYVNDVFGIFVTHSFTNSSKIIMMLTQNSPENLYLFYYLVMQTQCISPSFLRCTIKKREKKVRKKVRHNEVLIITSILISLWIFFGFRYLSMAVLITSTFIRYLLFLRLLMTDGEWNGRETYTFYLDLITDVITLAVDLASFLIIFVSVNEEGKKKLQIFIFRNLFHSNQF